MAGFCMSTMYLVAARFQSVPSHADQGHDLATLASVLLLTDYAPKLFRAPQLQNLAAAMTAVSVVASVGFGAQSLDDRNL